MPFLERPKENCIMPFLEETKGRTIRIPHGHRTLVCHCNLLESALGNSRHTHFRSHLTNIIFPKKISLGTSEASFSIVTSSLFVHPHFPKLDRSVFLWTNKVGRVVKFTCERAPWSASDSGARDASLSIYIGMNIIRFSLLLCIF